MPPFVIAHYHTPLSPGCTYCRLFKKPYVQGFNLPWVPPSLIIILHLLQDVHVVDYLKNLMFKVLIYHGCLHSLSLTIILHLVRMWQFTDFFLSFCQDCAWQRTDFFLSLCQDCAWQRTDFFLINHRLS